MPLSDVRALVFDTFGTLVDWRTSLIDELTAWGAGRRIDADWTLLVDGWRAGYAPSMDRVRRGEQPWTSLDALHRATLERLVTEMGIAGLTDADLVHLTHGWHRLRPWPDAVPGLSRLRPRFILAPLSNGNVSLLLDLARFGGLPWDMLFGSDLFGHFKPDAETYLGACRLLDLAPGQVMMCAAHNQDLAAAQKLGLRTAFIPRPTEYGPDQVRDLVAEGTWDVAASDLLDLADQLLLLSRP